MEKCGLWVQTQGHGKSTFGDVYAPIADFYAPLLDDFNLLWWAVCVQSGPISSAWLFEADENDEFYYDACVPIDTGRWFDTLWRPNFMKRLAPHVCVDEWSYFVGFCAESEAEARQTVAALNQTKKLKDLATLSLDLAEICILDIDDGLLFIFSSRLDWLETLRNRAVRSVARTIESFAPDIPYFDQNL